jgi:hypothetical protein
VHKSLNGQPTDENTRALAEMVQRAKLNNNKHYLHFLFENYQTYGVSSKQRKDKECREAFQRYQEEQKKKRDEEQRQAEKKRLQSFLLPSIRSPKNLDQS